ncbi:MAG: hypothetical protein PHU85_07255 [Phycisphaerae bacterium]|nr:hypothetical protein [Phycisphaerae bacterium]
MSTQAAMRKLVVEQRRTIATLKQQIAYLKFALNNETLIAELEREMRMHQAMARSEN